MSGQNGGFTRAVRKIAVIPIELYRKIISPLFPSTCRYSPSCSRYSRDAILRFGILRGGLLALGRILRCWGWFSGGNDDLPERWSWADIGRGYRKFYRGPGSRGKE